MTCLMPLASWQLPAAAAGDAGGFAPADCEDTPSASAAATATAASATAVIPRLPFIWSPPLLWCPPSGANLNDSERAVHRPIQIATSEAVFAPHTRLRAGRSPSARTS